MMWEQLFKVGAEGGSLTVMGRQDEGGGWSFLMVRDESILRAFIDGLADEELYDECHATTWEGILEKLDRYPWVRLYPLGPFHDQFKGKIWDAVVARDRGSCQRDLWVECCSQT